jgi:hypothetical protein
MASEPFQLAHPRLGVNIAANAVIANSGTVVFSNSGGFVWGMLSSGSSLVVTASAGFGAAIQSISAGAAQVTSGTVVLSNSGGISFGVSGQTVTAQMPQVSYWDNRRWGLAGTQQINTTAAILFQRVSFLLGIQATRLDQVNIPGVNATQFSMALGTMSFTPGEYIVGLGLLSSTGTQTKNSGFFAVYTMSRSTLSLVSSATGVPNLGPNAVGILLPVIGPDFAPGGGDYTNYFAAGAYSASLVTAAPPSVQLSEIQQTQSDTNNNFGMGAPYFQMMGTF